MYVESLTEYCSMFFCAGSYTLLQMVVGTYPRHDDAIAFERHLTLDANHSTVTNSIKWRARKN